MSRPDHDDGAPTPVASAGRAALPTLGTRLPQLIALARRRWRDLLGFGVGVYLASLMTQLSIGDRPAPLSWTLVAAAVVLGGLVARPRVPPLLAVVFAAFALALTFSVAHGSSLAMATWWPAFIAVFLVGRFFPAAVLGFTLALLLRNAGPLVILGAFGGTVHSGSTQYFMGMIGAAALPFWFALSLQPARAASRRVLVGLGVFVSALAVWSVLVANSRASFLALVVVVGVACAVAAVRWFRQRFDLRPLVVRGLVVLALVPVIDVGLGLWFGDGSSTVLAVLPQRTAATVAELDRIDSGPFGMRLGLWRQAVVMVAARPQGHGPGSYGHVIHAYQIEPMLWSASPHNLWALVGIETGVAGLLALLALTGVGVLLAARERPQAALALVAVAVVMALDIFDTMPPQALAWWLVLGVAWRARAPMRPWRRHEAVAAAVLAAVVVFGVFAAARFALPCDDGCDPMERYAGHPRFVDDRAVAEEVEPGLRYEDSRWGVTYPLSYWTRDRFVRATAPDEATIAAALLPSFPLRSPGWYLQAAELEPESERRAAMAACGLAVFYGDQRVWRTGGRLSGEAYLEIEAGLQAIAGGVPPGEEACALAGISTVALALRGDAVP